MNFSARKYANYGIIMFMDKFYASVFAIGCSYFIRVCMDTLMKFSSFGDKILKNVNFWADKYPNFGTILFVNKFLARVLLVGPYYFTGAFI